MFKNTLGTGSVIFALMIGSLKAMDAPPIMNDLPPQAITIKRQRAEKESLPRKKQKHCIEYILTTESYPEFFYCVAKGLDLKPINSFVFHDPNLRVFRFDDNGRMFPTLSFNELAVYGQFTSLSEMDVHIGIFSKIGEEKLDKRKVSQFFSPFQNLNTLTLRGGTWGKPESPTASTLFEALNEASLVKLRTLKVHFTGEQNFNSFAFLDALPPPGSPRAENPLPSLKYLEVTCSNENTQCTYADVLVIANFLPKLKRISLHDLTYSKVFSLKYPMTK